MLDILKTFFACLAHGEVPQEHIHVQLDRRNMDMTLHVFLLHLLHANVLGLGASSSTKVVLLNFIILGKRFANLLCIFLVDLLLAKQLDSLGDKLDGQLDIYFCSGCDNIYLALGTSLMNA